MHILKKVIAAVAAAAFAASAITGCHDKFNNTFSPAFFTVITDNL